MNAAVLTSALFACIAMSLALLSPPSDSDLFWHLASADWMLAHGQLLDRDVFSFTRSGVAYQSGQWLGDIVLGLVFRGGGWLGLVIARAVLIGIGVFFACRSIFRLQPHVGWAAVPAIAVILESRAIWGDRPQLFSLALFPTVFYLLLATRMDGRMWRLAIVPPLFLVWANLHGAFTAGLALIVVFLVESLLVREGARARALAITALGALLASFVNPAGLRAIAAGASYAATAGSRVAEEGPLDVLTGRGAIFAAFLLAAFLGALLLGREGIDRRVGPSAFLWAGLVIPFALLGLAIQRQAPFACFLMAPFAAAALPAALGRAPAIPPRVPVPFAASLLAVIAAGLVVQSAVTAPRNPDLTAYPEGALTSLSGVTGNLLNEYDWGGYLIHAAPDRPVFIDGRGAILYVPEVLSDWEEAVHLRPGYRDVLAKWDIGVALLKPGRPLAVALRELGWRSIAEEAGVWVLLGRPQ